MSKMRPQIRVITMLVAMLCLSAGGAFAIATDGSPQPPVSEAPGGFPENFIEDFDSYAAGSNMHGQGGWKGWDNNPAGGALVTNQVSHSSPNSVAIAGGSDLVHEFDGYTTGQWTMSGWAYVPGNYSGQSYFILLNSYTDGGPYNWSTQIQFDSGSGMVISEFEGNMAPIVYDQWAELRVEVDLDGDVQSIYYNDMLVSVKSWREGVSGGGITNIGAIDLFANGASEIFWDDVTLCPTGVGCGPVPTVGGWGLAALALLLMAAGVAALALRRPIGLGA